MGSATTSADLSPDTPPEDGWSVQADATGRMQSPRKLAPGGAWCAAAQHTLAQFIAAGLGKGTFVFPALALAGASMGVAAGVSVPVIGVVGGLAGWYAGKQVREGSAGGLPVHALFTLVPVLVPLVHAFGLRHPQEKAAELLGASAMGMLACVLRDLATAAAQSVPGRIAAIDSHGFQMNLASSVNARWGASAAPVFMMNSVVAILCNGALTPWLEGRMGAYGVALGDSVARALWAGVLTAWLAMATDVGYVPGGDCKSICDNLRDIPGILDRTARNTSSRMTLAALTTGIPAMAMDAASEDDMALQWFLFFAMCFAQAGGEFRGIAVDKYELVRDASRQRTEPADLQVLEKEVPACGHEVVDVDLLPPEMFLPDPLLMMV